MLGGGGGLEGWAIALIVVAVLTGVGLISIVTFLVVRERRGRPYFTNFSDQTDDAAEAARRMGHKNAQLGTGGIDQP